MTVTLTTAGPLPPLDDAEATYDVVVVGAGVVGAAVARELARYRLRTALVDASDDIGNATSKANTAILHTGFDAVPGSLEARLVREGRDLLAAYAAEAGIPVERVGALLVAWDEDQLAALPGLRDKAERNGYHASRIIGADELRAREPHLGPGALGALDVPDESIICPWTTPLAFATQAVRAGVHLHLNCRVRDITPHADGHTLTTSRGPLRTRHLVNAAGLHADEIDRLLGHDVFTVTPRRGQLLVLDKLARPLVGHILLPVPGPAGKGVLSHRPSSATSSSAPPPRTSTTRPPPAPPPTASASSGRRAAGSCPDSSTRRSPPSTRGCAPPPGRRTTASRSTRGCATSPSAASGPPASPRRWRSDATSWDCSRPSAWTPANRTNSRP